MKFIDLFCGIGGFHQALSELGHKCVFASDIDENCRVVYENNYGLKPNGDITKVNEKDIPEHDILCAGFPCQPFSNAGNKKGFTETRGTLFFDIERILKHHKTKYILLENVKHLIKHDEGNTWRTIRESLLKLGYILTEEPTLLSPNHIGIPQNRERVFILGVHKSQLKKGIKELHFDLPIKGTYPKTSIFSILEKNNTDKELLISDYEKTALKAWNEFKTSIPDKLSGFPVWVDEFGQNYNYDNLPDWKQKYIIKNRKLYNNNKKFIDKWIKKYKVNEYKIREKKFEWQAGLNYKSIYEVIVQFRQSGIRCKKPDFFPALVAMVQIPVIPKLNRKLSVKEVAKIQSFKNFKPDPKPSKAYKQFGNSVNVAVVKYLAEQLFSKY